MHTLAHSRYYSTELANRLSEHTLGEPDSGWTVDYRPHSGPWRTMADVIGSASGLYVVAMAAHEFTVPISVFYSRWSDDESRCIVWRTWYDRLPAAVREHSSTAYGAWHDPDADAIVFDVVRTFISRELAERVARANDQRAMARLYRDDAGQPLAEVIYL